MGTRHPRSEATAHNTNNNNKNNTNNNNNNNNNKKKNWPGISVELSQDQQPILRPSKEVISLRKDDGRDASLTPQVRTSVLDQASR